MAIPETRPEGRLPGDISLYCDTRKQSCAISHVYGVNFTDNEELKCSAVEIKVTIIGKHLKL